MSENETLVAEEQVLTAEAHGFDIEAQVAAAKRQDGGTDVHIYGLDEKPLFYLDAAGKARPVIIRVAGQHSDLYRQAEARIRKRPIKAGRRLTGDVFYSDNIEKVAACTLGWEGFISGGRQVEFTPHNVKQIYDRCPWVLDQVMEAMADSTRFFSNSSTPR